MRAKPCTLEGCCSKFCRGKNGHCSSRMDDVLDCFVDAEYDGVFKLKGLCASVG